MIKLSLKSLGLVALLSTSQLAHAWGQNGHRVVGKIAEQHLTSVTEEHINLILKSQTLPQVSTWADEMRSAPDSFWQKKSSRWHYINLKQPINLDSLNTHFHTTHQNKDSVSDILEGIRFSIDTLSTPESSLEQKQFSLKLLVHLVGDIHQPFHAGRAKDRGGNRISVTFFDDNTNLHSVWDTKLIENEQLSYTELASFIDTDDSKAIFTYLSSSPVDWAIESNQIAESLYHKNETELSYSYIYEQMPVVKKRLQQAGIRLAGLLNAIFDKNAEPLVKALKMPTKEKTLN